VTKKQRPEILLVDDELGIHDSVRVLLGDKFRIVGTTNTQAALHEFEKRNFDVVVADLALSNGERGIDLIRDLKKKNAHIPIIAFSGYSFERYRRDLNELGVTALLAKGSGQDLEEVILDAIEQAQSDDKGLASPKEPEIVMQVRTLLLQEIDRYSHTKERTLNIPGEGHFPLMKPLIGFKQDIERQLARFPYVENVFLMMKFRASNVELGEFIVENLRSHGLRGVRADGPEWNLTRNVYNPLAVLYCCKYGIALFDEPEPNQTYSANVAYELGMMHYQDKNCLILKHSSLPQLPFDLIKDLYVPYDKDLSLRRHIASWISQIAQK